MRPAAETRPEGEAPRSPRGLAELARAEGSAPTTRRRRAGRITQRAEYLALSRIGQRVPSTHFVFLVAKSDAEARLGITVTKKIAGAVGRNRWKRLIREAFRLHPDLVPAGSSLVVLVRRPAPCFTLADVVAEWRGVRRRLGSALERSEPRKERRS